MVCRRRGQTFLFSISLGCRSLSFRQTIFFNPVAMGHMWSYIGIPLITGYITRIKDITVFCCVLACQLGYLNLIISVGNLRIWFS
ncbi:Uncharacterised protein [Streptococcus pneumoniae]|nr:Uncharacterised protein [Streptococcus pneumoniae]